MVMTTTCPYLVDIRKLSCAMHSILQMTELQALMFKITTASTVCPCMCLSIIQKYVYFFVVDGFCGLGFCGLSSPS
jgi:hypothetical protein